MSLIINKKIHWIATIPATFMTAVSVTYILQAPEGFKLPMTISYPAGIIVAIIALGIFITKFKSAKRLESEAEA
ncbi:hypothetical protein Y919_12425 [Caloranaerobacter azorensis H53214]|uniref:Uncharacterized protein n=1 Tax=Caloranaerobacter azorensis H53214 TaxID=1156417 RepID=A0A096CS82_9FIRM|nr:hypothetical protein Y919_12425 [Caloranaerobacter azorensis H53214]